MPLSKQIKQLVLPAVYWIANVVYSICPRSLPKRSQCLSGMNFIGYYSGELGLGQVLRSAIRAAKSVAIPFGVRELAIKILNRQEEGSMQAHLESYAAHWLNCICMNPDMLYRLPMWMKYDEWANRYNVGYWFWELSQFPKSWRYAHHLVDEIWVNTDFVAQAVASLNKPVYKIPLAIEFEIPGAEWGREDFALPADHFIFLFSFDFHSHMTRKNPQAAIMAFKEAFPHRSESVNLVLKTSNGARYAEQRLQLEELIDGDPRIIMLDAQFTTEQVRGLFNVVDCYVSLHRSEGLGLGLAESMYLGKPVIGTAYSGNLEFMNADNSALVSYQLVPVEKHEYPFANNQVWAQPNVTEAAHYMRRMVDDPQYGLNLGQQAAQYIREHHSYKKMGEAMQIRLAAIAAQLPK